jgi:hypothetical protein
MSAMIVILAIKNIKLSAPRKNRLNPKVLVNNKISLQFSPTEIQCAFMLVR